MIIKFQRENGSWLIFGEVGEIIELKHEAYASELKEMLKEEVKIGDYQLFPDPDWAKLDAPKAIGDVTDKPFTFGYVKFVDGKAKERLILFQDEQGYICNDNGKTIERI